MYSFVVIADVHYDDYLSFSQKRNEDGLTPRLETCSNALKQVCDFCTEKRVKDVFCIGDLVDRKKNTSSEVLHFLKKDLSRFAKAGVAFYNIAGNHDFIDRECTKSISDILATDNILTFNSYSFLNFHDKIQIHCSPDTPSQAEDLKKLAEFDDTQVHILMAHVGINGAYLNDKKICEDSLDPKVLQANKYTLALLGDFHKHQKLSFNTYYVGALLQKNFGEENNPQHFLYVCGDENTPEAYNLEWIPLKNAPVFKTISPEEKLSEDFRGYVRVRSDTPLSQKNLTSLRNRLEKQSDQFFLEIPVKVQENIRLDFSDCSSLQEQVDKYIDHKAKDYSLDKDLLKQVVAKYLN